MRRDTGIELMRRALDIMEKGWPEMARAHLRVPLESYHSDEIAARERRLFETSPLALVASSEIGQPHDFLARQAVGRSVLLTRDADGVAHAFLNYCRHRGAEPARGCGNSRTLTCPYHAWVYDTKGRLIGMPLRDRYDDLDLGKLGLVELPTEERHGFVWVVLEPDAPIDVAAHLGKLDDEIASLGCAGMTYYNSLQAEPLDTNWKSVTEGLLEGIHVPFVHPDTFALNPQAAAVDLAFYDLIGPHIRYGFPMFGKEDVARLRATPESEWDPASSVACIWWISPGLLIAEELYGLIYADLTPGQTSSDAIFRYGWLSPVKEAPEGQPSPEEMAARAAKAVMQDKPVWEGCGRGLSRGEHGYALIGRNELGVQMLHESVAAQIGYEGLAYD
ncbi:MAG: aromatic ring-hydroxylating dioxygenase subunit alpha [Deltaproteobacteria bacterium]|jgi:phenylpropionate dioxygenase-like ring-hydroxylating dioxygenase large terminal subunit|nr:aromatic ring-hydroxylating dioxygenase subunit alpha [Deltaproteobacteria bacterium]